MHLTNQTYMKHSFVNFITSQELYDSGFDLLMKPQHRLMTEVNL